ncbi:hypothetical protein [Achromobacter kerstersii]|uniref:hypothetical protein n=1 Tax=Achromobacter kerstersii TaxID=1353890 RepID=UPI0015821585
MNDPADAARHQRQQYRQRHPTPRAALARRRKMFDFGFRRAPFKRGKNSRRLGLAARGC